MEDSTKIIITVVAGVALIICSLIGMTAYNNSQNVNRDEFVAGHCKVVSGDAANLYNGSVKYNCAGDK